MKNKNLIYQILISFVLVSVLTNMACLFIRNSVIQQEKLKAEYTVNSTINRVEIKLESYIEKVGFLKKTIEAGIDLDDAYFESVASRLYGDDPAVKTIELAPNGMYILLKKIKKLLAWICWQNMNVKRLLLWQKIQGNIH